MKICVVQKCNNKTLAKGFCSIHYDRLRYKGSIYKNEYFKICIVKKCNKKVVAKGLCINHYSRNRRNGNPNIIINNHNNNGNCKIKTCKYKYYGKELCRYHYNIQYYLPKQNKLGLTTNEYIGALNAWSKLVKQKDNYQCKICKSNNVLKAHHILYRKYFPKLILNLNNGITLCNKCHIKVHSHDR